MLCVLAAAGVNIHWGLVWSILSGVLHRYVKDVMSVQTELGTLSLSPSGFDDGIDAVANGDCFNLGDELAILVEGRFLSLMIDSVSNVNTLSHKAVELGIPCPSLTRYKVVPGHPSSFSFVNIIVQLHFRKHIILRWRQCHF